MQRLCVVQHRRTSRAWSVPQIEAFRGQRDAPDKARNNFGFAPGRISQSFISLSDRIERIEFRAGDVLVNDLGFEAYDVILLANVLHHFTAQDNAALVRRVSRALRTGGVCAILDLIRTPPSQGPRQIEALMDFYFAAASAAGIWTEEDLSGWQRAAGMKPLRLKRLWSIPECGLQIARKESAVGN